MNAIVPWHEQTPPASVEAEVAILGAFLIDNKAIPKVLEKVRGIDFYREAHRRIFGAAVALWEAGEAVDIITISEKLKDTGQAEAAGGFEYLAALIDAVPTAANVEYHAKIVREKAVRRRVIEAATQTIREAYEIGDGSLSQVAAAVERVTMSLEGYQGSDFIWLKEALWPTFEEIERLQETDGSVSGVPSGFVDLDRLTCGFQGGDLVVMAARPSMGKTAWMLDVLRHASIVHQIPAGIVSLEMTDKQLMLRLLCQEGRIDTLKIRKGRLSGEDHQRLAAAAGRLNTAPIYVDDNPIATITEVRAKATRLVQKHGVRVVAVDYMQLMEGPGSSRTEQVSAISRGLKAVARKLGIVVIALSQLSRGPEGRSDKRPMLSDLRESGSIEQDADLVMFLYRPEYYAPPSKREELEGKAELIIAKQRNGPTGMVPLYFQKAYTRFDSVMREPQQAAFA